MTKAFTPNDKYFYKAKELWYRARSAFKLLEIQEKFRLLKKWQNILDLWAFPWSWLQVVKEINQGSGIIIWVDLQEIKPIKWIYTYQCDVFSDEINNIIKKHSKDNNPQFFDAIISDMAPNTSWLPDVDQYRSVEVNLKALEVMVKYLKPWWWWVFKLFKWEDFNDFWSEAKKVFPDIKTFKPKSSRWRSVEMFCVGRKR